MSLCMSIVCPFLLLGSIPFIHSVAFGHFLLIVAAADDLLALSSKFTFDYFVKVDQRPLNIFLLPAGPEALSVEAIGEIPQKERCFASGFTGACLAGSWGFP